MPSSPLFPFTLALYAASCALFLAQLAGGGVARRLSGPARLLLGAAFLSHLGDIGFACLHGDHPFASSREATSFFAWLSVGAYLVVTLRTELPLAGALIVPVALVLDIAAHVGAQPQAPHGHVSSLLALLHVGLSLLGITAFAVASADAAVYLYAEAQLKARRRRHAPLQSALPPLEVLDRLNLRAIQLGFPIFTVAMVAGAVWEGQYGDGMGRFLRPQYALAALAWLLYAGLILARFLAGWRGRRAALLTLGGFASSLGALAIYYVRDALAGGGA